MVVSIALLTFDGMDWVIYIPVVPNKAVAEASKI
jgi:hypothetical protein